MNKPQVEYYKYLKALKRAVHSIDAGAEATITNIHNHVHTGTNYNEQRTRVTVFRGQTMCYVVELNGIPTIKQFKQEVVIQYNDWKNSQL